MDDPFYQDPDEEIESGIQSLYADGDDFDETELEEFDLPKDPLIDPPDDF
jgi:hypothetical protein